MQCGMFPLHSHLVTMGRPGWTRTCSTEWRTQLKEDSNYILIFNHIHYSSYNSWHAGKHNLRKFLENGIMLLPRRASSSSSSSWCSTKKGTTTTRSPQKKTTPRILNSCIIVIFKLWFLRFYKWYKSWFCHEEETGVFGQKFLKRMLFFNIIIVAEPLIDLSGRRSIHQFYNEATTCCIFSITIVNERSWWQSRSSPCCIFSTSASPSPGSRPFLRDPFLEESYFISVIFHLL